jgi:hypothetical protein
MKAHSIFQMQFTQLLFPDMPANIGRCILSSVSSGFIENSVLPVKIDFFVDDVLICRLFNVRPAPLEVLAGNGTETSGTLLLTGSEKYLCANRLYFLF